MAYITHAMEKGSSESEVLVQTPHWFVRAFLLFWGLGWSGIVLAAAGQAGGATVATIAFCGIGLVVASFFFFWKRIWVDRRRGELVVEIRWTFYRSERRFALANVARVYLRPIGKGREVGLQLVDGTSIPLGQPGGDSYRLTFAHRIADPLGVPVEQTQPEFSPPTKAQRVTMRLIWILGIAASANGVWMAFPASGSDTHVLWPQAWLAAIFGLAWTVGWWLVMIKPRSSGKKQLAETSRQD